MAALTTNEQKQVLKAVMDQTNAAREGVLATKPELLAVIAAIDTWFEANVAALNAAIPLPQRTNLTTFQKYRLLLLVLEKKRGDF